MSAPAVGTADDQRHDYRGYVTACGRLRSSMNSGVADETMPVFASRSTVMTISYNFHQKTCGSSGCQRFSCFPVLMLSYSHALMLSCSPAIIQIPIQIQIQMQIRVQKQIQIQIQIQAIKNQMQIPTQIPNGDSYKDSHTVS